MLPPPPKTKREADIIVRPDQKEYVLAKRAVAKAERTTLDSDAWYQGAAKCQNVTPNLKIRIGVHNRRSKKGNKGSRRA